MVTFEAYDDLLGGWFAVSGILQVHGDKFGAIWIDRPMSECSKVRISDGVYSFELTRDAVVSYTKETSEWTITEEYEYVDVESLSDMVNGGLLGVDPKEKREDCGCKIKDGCDTRRIGGRL